MSARSTECIVLPEYMFVQRLPLPLYASTAVHLIERSTEGLVSNHPTVEHLARTSKLKEERCLVWLHRKSSSSMYIAREYTNSATTCNLGRLCQPYTLPTIVAPGFQQHPYPCP